MCIRWSETQTLQLPI